MDKEEARLRLCFTCWGARCEIFDLIFLSRGIAISGKLAIFVIGGVNPCSKP